MAVAYKYTAGMFALPMEMVLLWTVWRHRSALVPAHGFVVLGGLSGLGAFGAWLWLSGAWNAFVEIQFEMVPNYVANTAKREGFAAFTYFFKKLFSSTYLSAIGIVSAVGVIPALGWLWKGDARIRLLAAITLVWWAVGATSTIWQGKFFYYHFLMLMAPMALLGGFAAAGLWDVVFPRLRRPWMRWAAATAVFLGAVGASQIPVHYGEAWPLVTGQQTIPRLLDDPQVVCGQELRSG